MTRCWLAVATLIGLCAPAVAADPQTVARIASYSAADRQAVLEAGARKEGELLIYAVGAQIDPVVKAFGAKYPFLTLKVFKGDIPVLLRKVTEEYRAGAYNVDAFELDDYGLEILREARMLTPFTSPEAVNYAPESIEPKKLWVYLREDYASLGFNTNAYAPDQVPQTYADLLDPKWKGKLGVSATESTLTQWVGAVVVSQGEAFFRKLGTQELRLYGMGGRAVSNLVVSGEVPIVVNSRYSHMFASRKDGAKVSWRALGPSYTAVAGVAIPTRSKNPHAAMLFTDFMLSTAAQQIYVNDLGYASLRKDMPSAAAPAEKLYLAMRPNYRAEYEQWGRLADQVLRKSR
jgi:iron(III) transport system substrate-binding protein